MSNQNRTGFKVVQSKLKEVTALFANLFVNWNEDSEALGVLLDNFQRQQQTMTSVLNTLTSYESYEYETPYDKSSSYELKVEQTRANRRGGEGEGGGSSSSSSSCLLQHDSLKSKLTSKILLDMDSTVNLLNRYRKRIYEVFTAMQVRTYLYH